MSMEDFKLESMQEGMQSLWQGYVDYAKSVVIYRALPDLRDGLKPVNRCTLYVTYKLKDKGMIKSQKITGDVIASYHPHGDASVYEALVPLTTANGAMQIPLLFGDSNFGNVLTDERHAAQRYTETCISNDALKYYCQEMNGIQMIPNFDNTTTMPELFPVWFPAVLCNSQEGVAVGFRGKMPSFNLLDVLKLTKEFIETGKCSTVIMPDFVTGGFYIQNNKELQKLMTVGTAKIKLRARVEIRDKDIIITEFPYGKTLGKLAKQIESKNIQGIRAVKDQNGYDGVALAVECTSKNKVDEVLYSLYKNTDLQSTFSADLTCILNDTPVTLGVWGIIEKWVEWRREVLKRSITDTLSSLKTDLQASRAFIELLKDKEKCDEFCRLVMKVSAEEGVKYLLANFDNEIITSDLAHWLTRRRISDFKNGGRYAVQYQQLTSQINALESDLENVDAVIIRQLDSILEEKKISHARRTEITSKDYNFNVIEEEKEVFVDTSICYYTIKENFIRKYRYESQVPKDCAYMQAPANVTLIGVDNRGRVIRIYCKDIPYTSNTEIGVYIPSYLGIEETDDYSVLYLDVLDGKKKLIIYNDGYLGTLDTAEWLDCKKQIRVVERGVDNVNAKLIAGIEDFDENSWLYVCDNLGRLSYVCMSTVKQMNRTARKKVFDVKKGSAIRSYAVLDGYEGYAMLKDVSKYGGARLKYLNSQADLTGDLSKFKLSYVAE